MMNTHPTSQRSISKDLTIGLILVMIIVSSFALLVAYYASKQKAEAELEAKAEEYTDTIRNTLVLPLWNYDFETIQAVCHAYMQNDLIAGIQVNDPRNLVKVDMVKKDVQPTLVRTIDFSHFGQPVGQARISLAYGYLNRLNRQLFWSFALVILTNLVSLVAMTGIILRLSLKRPLILLNEIVGSYAAGITTPPRRMSPTLNSSPWSAH